MTTEIKLNESEQTALLLLSQVGRIRLEGFVDLQVFYGEATREGVLLRYLMEEYHSQWFKDRTLLGSFRFPIDTKVDDDLTTDERFKILSDREEQETNKGRELAETFREQARRLIYVLERLDLLQINEETGFFPGSKEEWVDITLEGRSSCERIASGRLLILRPSAGERQYGSDNSKKTKSIYAKISTFKIDERGKPISVKEDKPISEQEYDDLLLSSVDEYQVFIVDRGEYRGKGVGAVFFNEKPCTVKAWSLINEGKVQSDQEGYRKFLTQSRRYKILIYALKTQFSPKDVFSWIEHCWQKDEEIVEKLRTGKMEMTQTFSAAISKVGTIILEKEFKGARIQLEEEQYRLTPPLSFCLIEVNTQK